MWIRLNASSNPAGMVEMSVRGNGAETNKLVESGWLRVEDFSNFTGKQKPLPVAGKGREDFIRLWRVHHAIKHLRVVPRRGQITDGPAGAGNVGADVLPTAGEAEMP